MSSDSPQFGYIKKLTDKYSALENNIYSEAVRHNSPESQGSGLGKLNLQANAVDIAEQNQKLLRSVLTKLDRYTWNNAEAVIAKTLDRFDAYIAVKRIESTILWLKDSSGIYTPYYLVGMMSDFKSDHSKILLARLLENDSSPLVLRCAQAKTEEADYLYDLQDFLFSHRLNDTHFKEVYSGGQLAMGASNGIKLSAAHAASSLFGRFHNRTHLQELSDSIGSNIKRSSEVSKIVSNVFKVSGVEAPELSPEVWRNYRVEIFMARAAVMNGVLQG